MATRHEKYMDMLHLVAEAMEPVTGYRVAAAVVYQNDLVSIGMCSMKSHPLQKKFGKNSDAIFLHAEISAIAKALRHISLDEMSKSTLYILRLKRPSRKSKDFVRALAKPCEGCSAAIKNFGIEKVYYTNDDGEIE